MKRLLLLSAVIGLLCSMAIGQTRQEYAYGGDPLQRLDVYRPAQAGGAPTLVMLHGGGWQTGDKRSTSVWRAKADHWTGQGYVFISVNTRLLPEADPISQARDLATAMRFIQKNSGSWGGDAERIILMGHSAGAHVAGLLATRNDLRREAAVQPWNGTILLDSAALDVTAIMQNRPARLYRQAFGTDPVYWQAASPQAHLSRRDSGFLIVCSTERDTPCPAARAFGQTAAAVGVSVTILPLAASHREINVLLGQQNRYTTAVDNWIASRN